MMRLTTRHGIPAVLACALLAPASTTSAAEVTPTFSRDVAPIFQEKCESCHRPGYIAPMSLVTYEEARPWARSIKNRVNSRQMPPWHIDRTIGIQKFKNDKSLTEAQIDTIVRWVDAGAPKGDPKDMPGPKKWPDESVWQFAEKYGPPDLIVKSTPYTMPAVGMDNWWKPVIETGLKEPRWVRAIEIRPTTVPGRKITHHALARLIQTNDNIDKELLSNDPDVAGDGLFMEWAVGKNGDEMREDSGRLMLPGSRIAWDIHYHAAGEQITDTVELGIYFYPKGQEPKHREVLALFSTINGGNRNLDIAPNAVTVTDGFAVLKENARIENFQAHLHLRGKGMSMEAIYADGRRQMLSQISDFNFNWHTNYIYADDVAPLLPKGTMLHFVTWYDNTSANKANPDPNQWVGWGDRTVDEMGHAWLNITYYSDAEFKEELKARATMNPPSANTGGQQQ